MDTYRNISGMQPNVPEWTLADRLRKIRRDRHMTQEAFAAELGVKAVTFASWEAGRSHPVDVIELAVAIERRFQVPAAWTLGVLNTNFDRRGSAPASSGSVPEQRLRRRWSDPPLPGGGSVTMMTA
jgi:transcriptional regulator with XRE-family HTH domain